MRVTLIQGGGMGLDQVPAVKRILEASGVAIEWDEHLAGWASMERGDSPIPEPLLKSVRETGLTLKIRCCRCRRTLAEAGRASRQLLQRPATRKIFDQYQHVLAPFYIFPARTRWLLQGVDMLVIRELTEDLYAAIEHEIVPGVVQVA